MTHLSAAAFAIDTFGRDSASSTNPEQDLACLAPAGNGGLANWVLGTALARAIAGRMAKRQLTRAVARLSETSPHLLADIGLIDTPVIASRMSVRARFESAGEDMRKVAAPVPVPARPAQRPVIVMPQRAPASEAVKTPVTVAGKPQPAAQ